MVDMSPIEPGTYPGKVVACTPGLSKSDNQKVDVDFAITVVAGDDPRPRTASMVIEGKGTWTFDQFLRAIHMEETADRLKAGEDVPIDTDAFIDQELQIIVGTQVYQGKERDSIDGYLTA